MTLTRKLVSSAVLALLAGAAFATPSVDKLSFTPASGAKVGDKVVLTVEMSGNDALCGIEVETGDGTREVFKVKPDGKPTFTLEHVYQKPGDYKVRAAGSKVENAFACTGKQIAQYKVDGAEPAKAAAPECPADWMMKGKPAKNGAYTCVPAKGVKDAKKPEKALACPTGTSYFTKGKTLGCE